MKTSLGSKIKAANKALIANSRLDSIGEFFATDYQVRLTGAAPVGGHDAVRQFIGMLQRAFPKLLVEVEILVEQNDRVSWQRTLRGIQRGAFHGFPASGRQVLWREMVTSRFRDGLIAEEWLVSDLAERLLLSRKRKQARN